MGFLQYTKPDRPASSAGKQAAFKPIVASDWISVHYHLDVEGLLVGVFDSISGGDMEINVIKHDVTYNTGDSTTLLIPGTITFQPITLSRGLGNSSELYNWLAAVTGGDIIQARRNGSITLNHHVSTGPNKWEYEPVVRWNFYNAWPTKISGFEMDIYQAASYASFKITIQAETIERVDI